MWDRSSFPPENGEGAARAPRRAQPPAPQGERSPLPSTLLLYQRAPQLLEVTPEECGTRGESWRRQNRAKGTAQGGGLASSKPGRAQGCTAGGSDTHTAPSQGAEPRHGSGGALWEPRKPPRSLSRGVLAAPSAHSWWQWLNWGSKRVGSRAHVGRPASREMRDGENLGRFKLLLTPRSSRAGDTEPGDAAASPQPAGDAQREGEASPDGNSPLEASHHQHPQPLRNGDFFNPTAPRDTTGSLGQPETP